jgi:hypothetical protein
LCTDDACIDRVTRYGTHAVFLYNIYYYYNVRIGLNRLMVASKNRSHTYYYYVGMIVMKPSARARNPAVTREPVREISCGFYILLDAKHYFNIRQ